MKKISILATIVACTLIAACTDLKGADGALLDAGYTDITITGYDAWGCSKDDTIHTGFTATGPTGRKVTGTVCSGAFKGETIRLKRTAR